MRVINQKSKLSQNTFSHARTYTPTHIHIELVNEYIVLLYLIALICTTSGATLVCVETLKLARAKIRIDSVCVFVLDISHRTLSPQTRTFAHHS